MGQLVGGIKGIREACATLEYPVVSGNVSLYNETGGQAILPTPVIGGVGLIDDYKTSVGLKFKDNGDSLFLIGDTKGHLGQSIYLREIENLECGSPPAVNLKSERSNGDCVRKLINAQKITACHDVSDGGVLVSLAEMAMVSNVGIEVYDLSGDMPTHYWGFGEDQGRYIIVTSQDNYVIDECKLANVSINRIGKACGSDFIFGGQRMSIEAMKEKNEAWLPNYMA